MASLDTHKERATLPNLSIGALRHYIANEVLLGYSHLGVEAQLLGGGIVVVVARVTGLLLLRGRLNLGPRPLETSGEVLQKQIVKASATATGVGQSSCHDLRDILMLVNQLQQQEQRCPRKHKINHLEKKRQTKKTVTTGYAQINCVITHGHPPRKKQKTQTSTNYIRRNIYVPQSTPGA